MKVQLDENQLERTDVAGDRPVTAQVNPNLFARLAGSSGSLGEALVKFGADKMRYDAESKKFRQELWQIGLWLIFQTSCRN